MLPPLPSSTLFPYTTLFRSALGALLGGSVIAAGFGLAAPTVIGTVVATVGFAMLLAVLALLRIRSRRRLTQRSEEHMSELQSRGHLVCRLLLEKKNLILCMYLVSRI